jgi:hypothetical protein
LHHQLSAIQPRKQHGHGTHHGQSGVNRDTNTNGNSYADGDRHGDSYCYGYSHSDANRYRDSHNGTYSHPWRYTRAYAGSDTYPAAGGAISQSLDPDASSDW